MAEKNAAPSETVKVYSVPDTPLTKEVLVCIKAVAKGMLRHSCHNRSDFADICQELALGVIKAFEHYDRTRSSYYTYAQTIISRRRDYIYRKRMRKGLDVENLNIDLLERDDLLIDERILPPEETFEKEDRLSIVRNVVAGLPADQQLICNMIMDKIPMSRIFERSHLTPSQFYHRVWPEIQQAFKKNWKKCQK